MTFLVDTFVVCEYIVTMYNSMYNVYENRKIYGS